MRRILPVLIVVALMAGAAAFFVLHKSRPALNPDGTLKVPLKELPGYKLTGELEIQPLDRGLVNLYGPYEADTPIEIPFRIMTKIMQAANGEPVSIDLTPPSGPIRKKACAVNFEKDGIYRTMCTFDQVGDWNISLNVGNEPPHTTMKYQAVVIPQKPKPTPTPKPVATPASE